MNYINEVCNGCGKVFTEDDDIVVCPECGTPQHRECYLKDNKCVNDALHAEGFVWTPAVSDKEEEEKKSEEIHEENPQEKGPIILNGPARGMVFGSTADEDRMESLFMMGVLAKKDEEFDGIKVADAAMYIQNGARRYINKYMHRSHAPVWWNWAAFFLTAAWFFYRKMYKFGLIILAATIVFSTTGYFMFKDGLTLSDSTLEWVQEIYENQESDKSAYESMLNDTEHTKEKEEIIRYTYSSVKFFAFSLLIPAVISAVSANYVYKKKMKDDINIIKQDSNEAAVQRISIMYKGGTTMMMFFIMALLLEMYMTYLPEIMEFISKLF